LKIFVSYSRRDAGDFAEQIRESLIDEHEVFTDVNNIQLGDVWSNIIEENISTCDIFVVIVTYRALQSPHVESEILQAQRENKKIIPCFHKSVTNGYIKWGLDKIQGIEFTNEYQLARDLHYKIAYHDSSNKNRGRIFETTPKTAETNKISPPKLRIDLKVIISIMAIAVIVSIIIVIMFFPFNNLPIANAGSNQAVDSRDIVILNGNKSRDSDGNIVSYSWNQIDEGPKVALNNPYTSNPSFRAPIVTSDTKLTFTLTVKDNKGNNSTNFASVDITVKAVNDPPIANNQTIITTINKPVNITLTAYDPQRNDTVTAQIVSQPSNGSLSEINQETGLI
jgi:hypothetical protein